VAAGRKYEAQATRDRLARWKLFDPIVLASYGVARPYADAPSLMLLDWTEALESGDRMADCLSVRVCNDDPSFAPPGHAVIQVVLPTDYDFWATRGSRYGAEKDALGDALLERIEPFFPGLRPAVRMVDIATPLTYWNMARSWRGAFEGWMPSSEATFGHVSKKLGGLSAFYMAGQWVEPGGGIPMAVMSGRQVVQLICRDEQRSFCATPA
jgi:phytoene dehydrogenase-like protein